MQSCVLIVPTAHRDNANAIAEMMGWGPNNFSVPLSVAGSLPATHYSLHAWVAPEFVEMLAAAGDGTMPNALAGFPPSDFAAVVGNLVVSIRDDLAGHFADLCATRRLALVMSAGSP